MRPRQIVPYAIAMLVGQAALEAVPGIIAEREGGMGLGSALIVAQVVQVAGLAFGATLAAYLVDRGSTLAALLAGAALFCTGMLAVEMQPMHALSWVVAGLGLAGAGLGIVVTVAFAMAAGVVARERPQALVLLLLTPLLARAVIGPFYALGSMALILGAVTFAGLAVLGAGLEGVAPTEAASGRRPMTGGRALAGGALLSAGLLMTLGGADPSRLSGVLIAGWVGFDSFETLELVRIAMLAVGLALVLAAALVLLRGAAGRSVALAVPAVALAALASTGLLAALRLAHATDAGLYADRSALAGLAAASGGALGIVMGAWRLTRTGEPRRVAIAGGVILGATTLVVLLSLFIAPPPLALVLGAVALLALAGGLVAIALRLVLADVPPGRRGLAAGAGVVAAASGSVLGSMIGAGEGIRIATGEPGSMAVGSFAMVVAAIGGLIAVGLLPASRQP